MGAAQSAQLQLKLTQRTHRAGDILRGSVILTLTAPVDVGERGLVVKLLGEAKTHWIDLWVGPDGLMRRVTHIGTEKVFQAQHQAFSGDGMMQPGQYVYPFSIPLPKNLSGSLVYARLEDDTRAFVVYAAQAVCAKSSRIAFDITSMPVPFMVLPIPPRHTGPSTGHLDSSELTTCLCISRGSTTGFVAAPSDVALEGTVVALECELHNDTRIHFSSVTAALRQDVWMKAKGGKTRHDHFNFEEVVLLPEGLAPGASAQGLRCSIRVPRGMPVSMKSEVLTVKYCWQLKATTSKTTKDIRMQAPITVSMALPGPEAADTAHPLDPALDNPPSWYRATLEEQAMIDGKA